MNLTDYSAVTALLERHGFRFSKSMGQNFLTAVWVPERIAQSCGTAADEAVLEIGPGVGCLTVQLSERAGQVLSVELDNALRPVLAETLADKPNCSVYFGDALETDLPALCRERAPGKDWRVCANLPYNVATPLITGFLQSRFFKSVTVMVQKEVAERLCAPANTPAYGYISVLADYYASRKILFTVGADCFVPRPKVTSAVLRLDAREGELLPPAEEAFFFRTVKAAFAQRRKTLSNTLRTGFSDRTKEEIDAALQHSGIDGRRRGETLTTEEFLRLSHSLQNV